MEGLTGWFGPVQEGPIGGVLLGFDLLIKSSRIWGWNRSCKTGLLKGFGLLIEISKGCGLLMLPQSPKIWVLGFDEGELKELGRSGCRRFRNRGLEVSLERKDLGVADRYRLGFSWVS